MSFKSFSTDSDKTAKRRIEPSIKKPSTQKDAAASASANKSTQAMAPTDKT